MIQPEWKPIMKREAIKAFKASKEAAINLKENFAKRFELLETKKIYTAEGIEALYKIDAIESADCKEKAEISMMWFQIVEELDIKIKAEEV